MKAEADAVKAEAQANAVNAKKEAAALVASANAPVPDVTRGAKTRSKADDTRDEVARLMMTHDDS